MDWIEGDISRAFIDIKLFIEVLDLCLSDKSNSLKAIKLYSLSCLNANEEQFSFLLGELQTKVYDIFLNYSPKCDLLPILPYITSLLAFQSLSSEEIKFIINEHILHRLHEHIYELNYLNDNDLYEHICTFLMLLLNIKDKSCQVSIVKECYNEFLELLENESSEIIKITAKSFVIFHEILYKNENYISNTDIIKIMKRIIHERDQTLLYYEIRELESYIDAIENDEYFISTTDNSSKFLSKNIKSFLIKHNVFQIDYSYGFVMNYIQKSLKMSFSDITKLVDKKLWSTLLNEIPIREIEEEPDWKDIFNEHDTHTINRQKKKLMLFDI